MNLEKVYVSFVPEQVDEEISRMDSEGSPAEGDAIGRAIRRSGLTGEYFEDVSPQAIAMEGEGPGSLIERDLIARASQAVRGLVSVEWRIDRTMGAAIGKSVFDNAIPKAKRAAGEIAEQNGPRIPGSNGNGKA